MSIEPGQSLLHYRVVAKIGEGGMGEVYRAEDSKLGRDVALKLLPPAFASDPERMARFEREARMLAALDHPGIASIYGLEELAGRQLLVMQLVEGPTLGERMAQTDSPLSIEAAVAIAAQIAEALEAAHENGIIHRDLKPANVKVGGDGKVTLLDFGLARALEPTPTGGPSDPAHSPTLTAAGTAMGMIMGTAAYMSPEQAAGQPVDRRCDIWSFGVVLFEMLSGRRLFEGETVSHTLADVLRAELDWGRLPDGLPYPVRRLLERCLDRDPLRRLRDIGEARIRLRDLLAGRLEQPAEAAAATDEPRVTSRGRLLPWAVAGLATLLAVVGFGWRLLAPDDPPRKPRRFTIKSPHGGNFRLGDLAAVALSPDGSVLVRRGFSGNDDSLYLRPLDRAESRPISGTENSQYPFFSPDGKWIGFVTTRGLWKVNLLGGAPVKIGEFRTLAMGATWSQDGHVYFSSSGNLLRVPERGGESEIVAEPREEFGEQALLRPFALPEGSGLVYDVRNTSGTVNTLQAIDLENGTRSDLGLQGTNPSYTRTGHLLFQQEGALFAVAFDPGALALRGEPVPLPETVRSEMGNMSLTVSDDGTLAYLPAVAELQKLLLVDRQGGSRSLLADGLDLGGISDPRFSPDGRKLVLSAEGVWIIDLETGIPTLVAEEGFYPVWSPDGTSVVYGVSEAQSFDLYTRAADLSRPPQLLLDWDNNLRSAEWAVDGTLIFREEIQGKGMDLLMLDQADFDDPEDAVRSLFEGPDDEIAPSVSPDGHWLAWVSARSGRDEVYVSSFPEPGGLVQVSIDGGSSPSWSGDGKELFYMEGQRMVAVRVETTPAFRVVDREVLFSGGYYQYRWQRQYDVHPATGEFVMLQSPPGSTDIEVVLDWFTELLERVPVGD